MERSILEWSIRAVLMVPGVGAVLRLLRVRSAAVRHAAWTAVTVAMLLLPVWTQWGPSVTARVLPGPEPQPVSMETEPFPATLAETE
ncbi:MAG TPA: hypothetical protein VHC72_07100, partial [Bryobacteraceae bacterium]|nr:hypothetical protein [Bryobacteraceae bacterium]